MTVEVLATAKVNLRLEILGRGADGFHELRTSMLALSLGDLVRAEARDEPGVVISLQGEHAGGVPDDDQLQLMGKTVVDTFAQSEYRYRQVGISTCHD